MTDNFDKLYIGFHGDPRVQFGTMTGTKFSYRIPYSSYYSIYQPRNIMVATPEELYGKQSDEKKEEKDNGGNGNGKKEQKSSTISPITMGLIGGAIGGIIASAAKQNILVGILIGGGVLAGGTMLLGKK